MSYKSNYIQKNKLKDFEKLKKSSKWLLWEYNVKKMSNSHLKRMIIERKKSNSKDDIFMKFQ